MSMSNPFFVLVLSTSTTSCVNKFQKLGERETKVVVGFLGFFKGCLVAFNPISLGIAGFDQKTAPP